MTDAPETLAAAAPAKAPLTALLRQSRHVLIMLAVVAALVAVVHLLPLRQWLGDPQAVRAELMKFGWAAAAVFVAGVAVLVSVGVPRLLLCVVGGAAFGFLQGLLWAQIGTMLGGYATFLVARWVGQDAVLRRWPRLTKYVDGLRGGGVWSVVIVKQFPIDGLLTNTLLGIVRLGHWDFLIGMAIGSIPEAIPATLIGAGIMQTSIMSVTWYLSGAVVVFAIVMVLLRRFLRRQRALAAGAGTEAQTETTEAERGVE